MEIIDFNRYGALGEYLINNVEANSVINISSKYFTIYAFNALKDLLKDSSKVRFLFNEPTFLNKIISEEKEFKEFEIIAERYVSEFPLEISLKNELNQNNIAKACADFLRSHVEVKSVKSPKTFLDNSYYVESKGHSFLIQGQHIDFTLDGLGYSTNRKIQYLPVLSDQNHLNGYIKFFNEVWNNDNVVEDVKTNLINHIENLYAENSPNELYFATIFNLFKEKMSSVDETALIKEQTGVRNSKIWNSLYNFQIDAAVGAIRKLETYSGCIIADSVGLGKTFEALAVIKYYELRNYRVLVLTPKKLRGNWNSFKMNSKNNLLFEDRFRYDVLNHTDLSRESGFSGDIDLSQLNWGNYDLVVIDESHNFRNNNPVKGKQTRYEKLMDNIIKNGIKTKVLMLSATPVNTSLKDLRNQIMFATEGNDNALEEKLNIKSIENTLRQAQTEFNKWSEGNNPSIDSLLPQLNYDFFNLLNAMTIARSRKHIEKYYDTKDIGKFPVRLKPKSIKSDIDSLGLFPSMKEVNNRIAKLHLSIYSPMHYILPTRLDKYREKYDQVVKDGKSRFTQEDRESSLVNLMRVNILKRLESSIESFRLTIKRILNQTESTIRIVQSNKNVSNQNPVRESDDDDDFENITIGNKIEVEVRDLDKHRIIQDLNEDLLILRELLDSSILVDSSVDLKLNKLKEEISNKVTNPLNNDNKKVIVFTAFSDTASYLYRELEQWMMENFSLYSGIVTGSSETKNNIANVRNTFESNLIHFSPISNKTQVDQEISLLIATDCISEGQNLQDCDYLVNYDIHWNPVRIVQRFGRIDRIGSVNSRIQLVNFWPNMELDEYINLEKRVKGRMVMMDISATGEDDLLNPGSKNLDYRKEQLEQLQNDVVDIEELSGGISITDLNLEDFIMDLEKYNKINPNKLKSFPTGIYSISDTPDGLSEDLTSGVIFCLKQKEFRDKKTMTTSLYPYHLVYVKSNGEVWISNNNPKKILDIYKGIASTQKEVQYDLVKEFNIETEDGTKMDIYTELLEKAIQDIKGVEADKGIQTLFNLGESNILDHVISGIDDFELITFLVIK